MSGSKGPAVDYDYNDNCQRQRRVRRRQEDKETTTTGVVTTMVCPRVCDNHHYSPEEEERLTTMVTSTGESAQGEGRHYDTMTGSTAMVTIMQDRLQERSSVKRPTMSSDYIIRLTDRLQSLRSKCVRFFSQKPQRECVPKILGRPPRKKSGHHSSRSFEACPNFFFRTPSETAAGACPDGRVQGAEGLQVFSGAVSSGQLKYAVHIPRNFCHVTAGNLILTCTKCPRQINCDVATSCYLLIQSNKNRKRRWIIQNGLLNVLILATGFDFQNGKEQF